MGVMWDIQTPGVAGALAVVQLVGADGAEVDALLARLGVGRVAVGAVVLRDLMGVDRGIVARWSPTWVHLMPHGGAAVVRGVAAALELAGVARAEAGDALAAYPEAESLAEARMLAAIARASSPMAIDLLLDQPQRWRAWAEQRGRAEDGTPVAPGLVASGGDGRDRVLNRLIEPPLVVAAGAPNIGKSSLVNALAGRGVSIVADEPGTTRDHVGVLIDLAGLVVRWVDTPGLGRGTDQIERDAEALAREMAGRADLIVACGDRTSRPPVVEARAARLTVATRVDLGRPEWPYDVGASAVTGEGVQELVALIRDTLVPPAAMADPLPWRFW
jgi:tRNA U34 5-carboxymethylaminomethyl modifying GTPase MnmE/TrmE